LLAKGREIAWLPKQDDFRKFCMSYETEKVNYKLEGVIDVWYYYNYYTSYKILGKVIE